MSIKIIQTSMFCFFVMILWNCQNKTNSSLVTEVEAHRPAYHFTPDSMWMNDPNGMVYHDGEYHLFYQYFPDSTVWGPMHWGHAVSKDLVKWEHLPIALYPDSLGFIFSGSAVVDKGNTSGFGKDGKNPIVAIFTHHDMEGERSKSLTFQNQSIAYSNDNGRTFTKYEGNPVVKNPGIKDFRDPKVIWHEASKKWVMVFAAYDKVLFYQSPNLKDWTKTGEFGISGDTRLWECPDLFPIKVEGSNDQKWVLITSIQKDAPNGGTGTSYFIGDFDGQTFVGDPKSQKWLDYGTDNYAFVTWSNAPDGKILGLGWMSNWQYAQHVPTKRWRSAMTLPRELKLYRMNDDLILKSLPVKSVESIMGQKSKISINEHGKEIKIASTSYIDFSFVPSKEHCTLRFSNTKNEYIDIGFDPLKNEYSIDRTHAGSSDFSPIFAVKHVAPRLEKSDTIRWQIYLDVASVELFADGGLTTLTDIFFPSEPFSKLTFMGKPIFFEGERAEIKGLGQ